MWRLVLVLAAAGSFSLAAQQFFPGARRMALGEGQRAAVELCVLQMR